MISSPIIFVFLLHPARRLRSSRFFSPFKFGLPPSGFALVSVMAAVSGVSIGNARLLKISFQKKTVFRTFSCASSVSEAPIGPLLYARP